jgi:hypothetical protein
MIEGSDCLAVSDAFLLSNDDNQNIILHTTTEQITYETKTTETINAADIIPRPRSLTLIEKFRRIALYSFPSSRRRAARHSCDNILQPQINSASIIDGEVKLKVCSITLDYLYFVFFLIGNIKKFNRYSFVFSSGPQAI